MVTYSIISNVISFAMIGVAWRGFFSLSWKDSAIHGAIVGVIIGLLIGLIRRRVYGSADIQAILVLNSLIGYFRIIKIILFIVGIVFF